MIYKNWTDKSFGQIILVISVVIAFVLAIWFNIIGEPIPFSVMAWPAVGLLVGFAFIFGTALAKSINVSLEELPELLEDDLDALRKGQITTEHLYTAATAASMIAEVYLLGYYHKWMATWGSINVLFVALLVVLVALWYMLRSAWFQDRSYRLHHRFYVISAMGWLICIFLGAYCAEPIGFGRLSPTEQSQLAGSDNYWLSIRSGDVFYVFDFFSGGGLDCDDEICLMFVVILCVIGSATIPHFWVVATLLLLSIMMVISLRELLFKEEYKPGRLNSS